MLIFEFVFFSRLRSYRRTRRSPPSSITKGRLECSLSGYHSKVKERFKFSLEREAHDLFSRRVIFLSLRSGRQKPLRDEEETLSALSRGPGGEGTSLVFGQRRGVCLVKDRRATCHTADPPPRLPPVVSPSFTFALLAIIIRVLWLRGLNGTKLPATI